MARQQTEKDIQHLAGLSKIRAKVSMYLGSSDGSAMWTALREALDNTIDEANQGRNDYVHLIKDPHNKWGYWVVDHGGGMPVKDISVTEETTNKKVKISALKALVFLLHAGGKFNQSESEGGLRGCFVGEANISSSVYDEGLKSFTTKAVNVRELYSSHNKGKGTLLDVCSPSGSKATLPMENLQITKCVSKLAKVYVKAGAYGEPYPMPACTVDHPFYVRTLTPLFDKIEAQKLESGMLLVGKDKQTLVVDRVETLELPSPVPVYGVTLPYAHTYYVQSSGGHWVLVGNTHGVGLKATNAVSTNFSVYTKRDGSWYSTIYQKGVEVSPVAKCKAPTVPTYGKATKGTVIYVEIDPSVFDKGSRIDENEIISWFQTTSYFTEGVLLKYTDSKGTTHEWEGQDSETTLLADVEELKATLLEEEAYFTASDKFWDLALAFTDFDGISVDGFASGLHNIDGGTHVQTVFKAVTDVVSNYANRKHKFNPTDLREGLIGSINIKLTGVKFHNQEKTKLVDDRAGDPLYEEIYPHVETFFKKNKSLAVTLCERASQINSLKQDFKANKAVMKLYKEAKKRSPLPPKLVSSLGCTAEERELCLVEGDSAGGSAKRARDSSFQEVLPLKGKIKNPFKQAATDSEELLSLLMAIGYDPAKDNPLEELRVGKVILLTDGDVDGLHIQTLILGALLAYVPELFEQGRVYSCLPYEYMVKYKDRWYFDLTMEGLKSQVPASMHGSITHIKGWGELDADVLSDMAFNTEKRRLYKIEPENLKKTITRVRELMESEGSVERKKLLGIA